MQTTPRPLFVLHPDRVLHSRLSGAVDARFSLARVDDWEQLREGVSTSPPAAVVLVDPYHGQEKRGGPSPHLYNLLKAFPSSTVVAAMDSEARRYRDIWMLGEWGVAEILQEDVDFSRTGLRRRLLKARAQPLRRLINQDRGVPLTGRARSLLEAAVDTVLTGGHPKDLAKTLNFSPSTLLRWCERAQLPNPRRLLLWMRILFASALLDDPGHTVFSVGIACGYSGDQALRRAIRSVVPYTPTELRELGAFETVSQAFFEELAKLRDDRADKR